MNHAVLGTGYHHGNLRATLVETGLAMAREFGPEGVVLRDLARRIGVSHSAAYRHFADREELLSEISEHAIALLTAAMQAGIDAVPDGKDATAQARARLNRVARAYVEFALAEPGLFRAASAKKTRGADALDSLTDTGPYGLINNVLDGLVSVGHLHRERRPGSEVACWAAVHGFAELCLEGPLWLLPPGPREAALSRLLDTIERGLGQTV